MNLHTSFKINIYRTDLIAVYKVYFQYQFLFVKISFITFQQSK